MIHYKKKPKPTKLKCLAKQQACKIFKTACATGSIIWGIHPSRRMEEYGIDANDILALGKSGLVFNPPEPHPKTGAWNYRIEHPVECLKVVFEVINKEKVRLITVIGKKK